MPRSRERGVTAQTTQIVYGLCTQGRNAAGACGRRPTTAAGFYPIPLFPMERNYESPDRRIVRVQAMIDDVQLVPVFPRGFTNRMLDRWYKERASAHITWRWFDRTIVVLAFALGIVNLFPW